MVEIDKNMIGAILVGCLLLPITLLIPFSLMDFHRTEMSGPFSAAKELSKSVERIDFRTLPSPPEFWKLTLHFNSMYSMGSWNLSNALWCGKSTYANDTLMEVGIELVDGNENGKLDNADVLWIVSTTSCLPGYYWGIQSEVQPRFQAAQHMEGPYIEDGSGYISFYRTLYQPPLTKLTILDVGMGNAAFIKGPSMNNYLINTGPDSKAEVVVDCLRSMKVTDLFALFITDDDPGSIGGLEEVLENFTVDYIFLPTNETVSDGYSSALSAIEKESNAHISYGPEFDGGVRSYGFGSYDGRVMKWGDSFDLYCHSERRPSMSIWYSQGPFHFFFCGNSTSDDEAKIAEEAKGNPAILKWLVPTTLIQVSNYGKEGATSDDLLETLGVRTAIVSVGAGDPELPSSSLMDHLAEKGIQTLRTDEVGNIVFVTDGNSYWRD